MATLIKDVKKKMTSNNKAITLVTQMHDPVGVANLYDLQ